MGDDAIPDRSGSSWDRLGGLPVLVESCEFERLSAWLANDFERVTTRVRLRGGGGTGRSSPPRSTSR